jgi:ankyrin repeat protein
MHMPASKHDMKHLLLTTIAAVLLVGTAFAGPIHDAARKGDIEAVKQHLAAGRNVNAKDDKGRTPLHRAAREGHKEVAELLIAAGADLNTKDKEGKTPLYHAARWGHTNIAALLIAAGADVNAKDDKGRTPLDRAVGYTEIVALLRKHGGKTSEELNALIDAAEAGNIEAVKQHLAAGMDVNAKDEDGVTPLHEAALWGHNEVSELLIANGAEVNAIIVSGPYQGKTPLDLAIRHKKNETADLLRKHGGRTAEVLALLPRLSDIRTYWERVQLAELAINGKVGLKYEVLYSSDLKEWHVMDTVTLETSPLVYVDKSATECPHWCLQPMRFYRVKLIE